MSAHHDILAAAQGVCSDRPDWTFTLREIVEAVPNLPASTVRTHVTSRLCVNAPVNHQHRWPYFRRVGRGSYEVLPPYRDSRGGPPERRPRKHLVGGEVPRPVRDTAHAVVSRDIGWWVAECLEVPVLAQGRSLDEVVAALRLGIERKLATDDPSKYGLTRWPRIMLSCELRLSRPPAASR